MFKNYFLENKDIFFRYVLPIFLFGVLLILSLQTRKIVTENTNSDLEIELKSRLEFLQYTMNKWYDKTILEMHLFEKTKEVQDLFKNTNKLNSDNLDELISIFIESSNLESIFILNSKSEVIYGNRDSVELEKQILNDGLYEKKIRDKEVYITGPVYFHGGLKFIVFHAAENTLKNKNHFGKYFGHIVFVYSSKEITDILKTAGRTGSTGETYLMNENGLLLTESRFNDDLVAQRLLQSGQRSALNLSIKNPKTNELTKMAKSMQKYPEKECGITPYSDYRGESVIGCWGWNKNFKLGIATEVDESEAFRSFEVIRIRFIFIFIIFFAFLYFYYMYLRHSKNLENQITLSNQILKNKNSELNSLMKAINKHVLISKTDKNGVITYVNDYFSKVSQFSIQDLIGKNHNVVSSGVHGEIFWNDFWRTIKSKIIWNGIIKNRAKDGSYYWVDTTIIPVLNENREIKEYISVRTDITSIKEAEENLIKSKLELEKYSRARSNFAAKVSHELRTPLNAIIGFLTVIKDEIESPKAKEHLDIVYNASENLLEIINDVLDFSKIEQGEVKLIQESFNLNELLNDIKNLYQMKQSEFVKFLFEVEIEDQFIMWDKVKLKQIITNLIGNSFKFTDKGFVKLTIIQKQTSLEVKVSDTGRGIPASKIPTIFSPFKQVEDSDALVDLGAGIGLAIVKSYVELMGGVVEVNSTIGEGTEFILRFQNIVQDRMHSEKKAEVAFDKDLIKGLCILVVDDNQINLKMMESLLKAYDVEVTTIQDPRECLSMCQTKKFDLIFMDQLMPHLNGVDVCNILKKNMTQIPLVVSLSASTTVEDLKLFSETFDEVLSKPVKRASLEWVFKKLFKANS